MQIKVVFNSKSVKDLEEFLSEQKVLAEIIVIPLSFSVMN